VPDGAFYSDSRYVRDPWAPGALDAVRGGERVLLLGTGLTMLDVAVELRGRSPYTRMVALSRRGLLPQGHRPHGVAPSRAHCPPGIEAGHASARGYVRAVREHVARTVASGGDWRDVVGSLRPITPVLWERLPLRERARFLRHVRPYWEAHRHRVAPEALGAVHEMIACGGLRLAAGRVLAFDPSPRGVRVRLRRRGAAGEETLVVDRVINCTGPASDVGALRDPLLSALRDAGLLRPDPLALGIDTSRDGALLDRAGRPSRLLYHVGPLLRAGSWESTAVPELRVHAQRLAETLRASLTADGD
jgi:uncharacterized NAD(P)/FAD-binding protein YdhS